MAILATDGSDPHEHALHRAAERDPWHFALVGTPNSGKTALFNALTGSRQKVANYPGVTVERKDGLLQTPAGRSVNLIDLPGTYSLRGRSPDEEITRDVVLGRLASESAPDLLLCVADATNLRLSLRLVHRAQARRPAAGAGAQHVRHRAAARHADRPRRACRPSSAFRSSPRSRCAATAPTSCCAAWTRSPTRTGGAGRKHLEAAERRPICAPPSARPTASSRPRSRCRRGPTR